MTERSRTRKSISKSRDVKYDVAVEEADEVAYKLFSTSTASTGTASNAPASASGKSKTIDTKKPPSAVINALKKVTEFHGSVGVPLEDEPFYHGYMERKEAEKCLTKIGEFLVRKSFIRNNEGYIISIRVGTDRVLHLHVQEIVAQRLYWVRTFCFTSISDLVRYHMTLKAPVYENDIKLLSYLEREQWQLYHEQIVLGRLLGHGEFGEVFQGTFTIGLFSKPIEVAVKTLKEGSLSSDDRVTFLREANVMLKLQHKHIIRLYGVATQKEPIMIVMELAPGGSLLEKIRKTKLDLAHKRKYCYHAMCGMEYLESQQVIHRDVAARNCLISGSDVCKISDFGLSMLGQLHKEKQMIKVPVRFLAPETLTHATYSSKSDVWSYGVLMFEVFSDGEIPYKEVKTLKDVRKKVIQGLRLKPPPDMPEEDANIMMRCFETDPEARTSFSLLKQDYKKYQPNVLGKLVDFFKDKAEASATAVKS
ncbi:unnamed protein product [Cylicocyclus nassatus]|uniref:Tyrosine-protein kinase n=1 Tax=Cylicocyclus nassatus TaxID=53992 RepID=A0AA36GJB3_CYLNA|nr:unnamed protein product [Cylicocyclus nassatus]